MNNRLERATGPVASVLSTILRVFVALAGVLLMLGALFIGLLLGLTLMLLALLRGRKPGMKFVWRKGEWPGRPGPRRAQRAIDPGEVVDIEAREVLPQSPQRN